MPAILNLDQQAAKHAQQLVKDSVNVINDAKVVENFITKTLDVLQKQGVYAMMLYLFSRTSDEAKIAPKLRLPFYELLKILPVEQSNLGLEGLTEKAKAEDILEIYADKVCHNLNTLLLVKEIYEQTLIYARFGAKAEGQR